MVADEVMAGFGRTGRWFAIDHWDAVPDLMTMAKGLTSSLPAPGRRGHAPPHRRARSRPNYFYGGLTYSSHPVSLAAALATISVYEEDGLIEQAARLGPGPAQAPRGASGPSTRASARIRNLGLFGILDLVRSRDPYDADDAVQRHLRRDEGDRRATSGATTCTRWSSNNSIHTNPPLCDHRGRSSTKASTSSIGALDIADQAVKA